MLNDSYWLLLIKTLWGKLFDPAFTHERSKYASKDKTGTFPIFTITLEPFA